MALSNDCRGRAGRMAFADSFDVVRPVECTNLCLHKCAAMPGFEFSKLSCSLLLHGKHTAWLIQLDVQPNIC